MSASVTDLSGGRRPVRIATSEPRPPAAHGAGPTAAERTTARAAFLHSITHDGAGRRISESYVDRDAALRADTYRAVSGVAADWPVPLTPCT